MFLLCLFKTCKGARKKHQTVTIVLQNFEKASFIYKCCVTCDVGHLAFFGAKEKASIGNDDVRFCASLLRGKAILEEIEKKEIQLIASDRIVHWYVPP